MSQVDELIKYNKEFVEKKEYSSFSISKLPEKKLAILSCMDTRLTGLLTAALNLKDGDAKIIKNAGGVISHPFGSAMRSLLVCVYELGVEEIMVIGHTDCGMQGLDSKAIIEKMINRGVNPKNISMINYCGVDFESWLKGFDDVHEAITKSVSMIEEHPLFPKDIQVSGFIMDITNGKLERII